jgi:hypothetical protein
VLAPVARRWPLLLSAHRLRSLGRLYIEWTKESGRVNENRTRVSVEVCFECGKPGHFGRDCPVPFVMLTNPITLTILASSAAPHRTAPPLHHPITRLVLHDRYRRCSCAHTLRHILSMRGP